MPQKSKLQIQDSFKTESALRNGTVDYDMGQMLGHMTLLPLDYLVGGRGESEKRWGGRGGKNKLIHVKNYDIK